jgi:NifU-like protein involved in Fe-S cluster formation
MELYSRETIAHFMDPCLRGPLAGGVAGEAFSEDDTCNDCVVFEVRLAEGRVAAVAQMAEGCVAVVAAASCLAQAVEGALVAEARAWNAVRLAEALGGMPARHGACLQVPIDALARALEAASHA